MSNHHHIILHIMAEQAKSWSMDEVIDRWHTLFKGSALTQSYLANNPFLEHAWTPIPK